MGTVQDKDVAIWVCRHGTSADVVEFPAGGKQPIDQACASHGEPLFRRCPNPKCPHPTYHPSDLDRNYHHCGERMPWAAQREENARAAMEYDTFNSAWVGREVPDPPAKGFIGTLVSDAFDTRIRRPKDPREDDWGPPPAGGMVGSPLQYRDLERTTWDQLERGEVVRVDPPPPPLWQRVLKGWWDLLFGSLQNAIGGLILLIALVVLAVYFGVRLSQSP